MRAYTILVQPADEAPGHIATVAELPGWAATGGSIEECVARARTVIGLFVDPLDAAEEGCELPGRAADGEASEDAAEEALDALHRAMAALRTVETGLEEEIVRRPEGDLHPLRRAHAALLRARRSLVVDERRTRDRALV